MFYDPGLPSTHTMRVRGEGAVEAPPDLCVVHLALNAMEATAEGALGRVGALANEAAKILKERGISPEAIRMRNLALNDFIDRSEQRVTARVASYQLEITIPDLDAVGGHLAALAAAAGDSLQVKSLQLGLKDPGPLRSQARRLAVEDAKSKAEELSEAAGVTLGKIVSIDDNLPIRPRMSANALAAQPAAVVPVEPGTLRVSSTVTVVYAIS